MKRDSGIIFQGAARDVRGKEAEEAGSRIVEYGVGEGDNVGVRLDCFLYLSALLKHLSPDLPMGHTILEDEKLLWWQIFAGHEIDALTQSINLVQLRSD